MDRLPSRMMNPLPDEIWAFLLLLFVIVIWTCLLLSPTRSLP